ncbi:hypothetical protein A9Q99_26765 [Gammaproteobacteria bacterium 45_16_T64]|nr:hypothetical protein A9Q99_26765 [Gammaproteobacteria bacterium 45_16_T64]
MNIPGFVFYNASFYSLLLIGCLFMGTSYANTVTLEESVSIHKTVYFFQRNRDRKNAETGNYEQNLHHGTGLGAIDIHFYTPLEGLDVKAGLYGAYDFSIIEGDKVNQENEFSFAGERWGDNYRQGDNNKPENGVSYSKLTLDYQLSEYVDLVFGFNQFRVAGLIGTNWSFLPGTSRGGGVTFENGRVVFNYVWIDRYKAPWFRDVQKFSTQNAWSDPFDSESQIDYLHGLSASTQFYRLNMTLSFAESEGYMESAFFKVSNDPEGSSDIKLSYQYYASDTEGMWDDQDNGYMGVAWLQAVTVEISAGSYRVNVESTLVRAEGLMGNYLPRLTRGYGNSQGALEIWWDLRSDWNHHNEKAVFLSVTRSIDDWIDRQGWSLRLAGAYGWGAEYSPADLKNGKESALGLDLIYKGDIGKYKDVTFQWHYVDFRNHQDDLGSWAFPNMFTSERDVQIRVVFPVD